MSKFRWTIEFGALAPSIADQVKAQGLQFDSKVDPANLERLAHAITLLRIQSVLSERESDRARGRLMKLIKVRQPLEQP